MSSIDKYVEGEARSINPRIVVRNENGSINGYIDGRRVFSIADRYGYLNDSERRIIKNSLNQYEEEEKERIRLEAIRIENERVEARTRLRNKIKTAKSNLNSSYSSAKKICEQAKKEADFSEELEKLSKFDISTYIDKVHKISALINENIKLIENDHGAKAKELDTIDRAVRDDSDITTYCSQEKQVDQIRVTLKAVAMPFEKINELKFELKQIISLIDELVVLESRLMQIKNDGVIGQIATNALKEIHQTSINSIADVENLIHRINESVSKIDELQFSEQTQELKEQILIMKGIAKSCSELNADIRSFSLKNYKATSYREDIIKLTEKVQRIYEGFETAEYTTCKKETILEVLTVLQEVVMCEKSDKETFELLQKIYDQGVEIQRVDSLCEKDYLDYKKKVEELERLGVDKETIESFDAKNYSIQSKRLNASLLRQDLGLSKAQTQATFLMACQAMEEMGYKMLSSDWGLSESGDDEETTAKKGLACEAVFVIPGCEGVVFQVVASDCGVIRRLVGIQRENGMSTSTERVKEVAKKIEESGEITRYFGIFSELGGGNLSLQDGAIDSDSENCESIIQEMGKYIFSSEDEEDFFDQLVKLGTKVDEEKWKSRYATITNSTAKSTEKSSRDFVYNVRNARYQEKKSKRHGN